VHIKWNLIRMADRRRWAVVGMSVLFLLVHSLKIECQWSKSKCPNEHEQQDFWFYFKKRYKLRTSSWRPQRDCKNVSLCLPQTDTAEYSTQNSACSSIDCVCRPVSRVSESLVVSIYHSAPVDIGSADIDMDVDIDVTNLGCWLESSL